MTIAVIEDSLKGIFPPSEIYSNEPPLETELHLRQIMLLLQSLEWLGAEKKDFYAIGNLTIYYSAALPGVNEPECWDFGLGCEDCL